MCELQYSTLYNTDGITKNYGKKISL